MAVRGDEVAEGIDAHVRETMEKMVTEIRSSIQDVREAVDQQLDAAMQSIQADLKGVSFRPFLQSTIRSLEEEKAAAVPPPPSGPDSSTLREAIQAIERGKSQVEVLNALLDQSLKFGSRSVLMILKGDSFTGWKGVGFSATGGSDEQVKRFTATADSIPELGTLLRDEKVVSWNGASISAKLGAAATERALLVPMVIKDKVAAALYVDVVEGSNPSFDQSSIELLVFVTALLIDTLSIRKKIPSPSLSGGATATTGVTAQPAPVAVPAAAPAAVPAAPRPAAPAAPPPPVPRPASPVAPTPAAPRPAPFVPPPPVARPASPAAPPPSLPSFQLESDPAPMAFVPLPPAPSIAPPPSIPPPAAPPRPPAPAGGGASSDADKPSTQYIPPPGLARGGALGGSQTEEGKKHDEARRFARLLVSEIKLYNESKVDQGRKNKDLYERMKEDIDRSRQMYDERIPEEVRKVSNYFYDELVRILADNDADALGL